MVIIHCCGNTVTEIMKSLLIGTNFALQLVLNNQFTVDDMDPPYHRHFAYSGELTLCIQNILLSMEPWATEKKCFSQCGGATSSCPDSQPKAPERLQAGIYLLFCTLFASLPLLVGIFYIYYSDNLIFYEEKFFYVRNMYLYLNQGLQGLFLTVIQI